MENKREYQEIKREQQELRKEFEKLRKDILNGQDMLVKLIVDKRESETTSASFRQEFKERIDKFKIEMRIKNMEEKLGISTGA